MKFSFVAFAVILSLAMAVPGVAEIYKYVDENGQTRWTDDLGQVPMAYRDSAERMESIESAPAIDATPPDQVAAPSDGTVSAEKAKSGKSDQVMQQALEKEKADLDALYRELQKEKNTLDQLTKEASDAEAKKKLNNRIAAYNKKIEQYETKRNQFAERVKAYNQRVTE